MNEILPQSLPALEQRLLERESAVPDLRPDNHARIIWADGRVRQPLAFVYLHGFSASPMEIAPVPQALARHFGANLYLPRLSGHGRPGSALSATTAADWQEDALEALTVGQRLGMRVVLLGTSTGATLATWLAATRQPPELAALLLVSPNFGVVDRRGWLLGLPGARRWLPPCFGRERVVVAQNAAQARYWTLRYPMTAVIETQRLVRDVWRLPTDALRAPLLAAYCREDQVVAARRTELFLRRLQIAQLEQQYLPAAGEGSNHVVVGNAAGTAAATTQLLERATTFLSARLGV